MTWQDTASSSPTVLLDLCASVVRAFVCKKLSVAPATPPPPRNMLSALNSHLPPPFHAGGGYYFYIFC